jgi:hypothetical protein
MPPQDRGRGSPRWDGGSRHSRRSVPIQRSTIAFARGARTGVRMMRRSAPGRTASKAAVNLTRRWRCSARGSRRTRAAKTARSAQSRRGLGLVRRSTATSCRSTRSSTSLVEAVGTVEPTSRRSRVTPRLPVHDHPLGASRACSCVVARNPNGDAVSPASARTPSSHASDGSRSTCWPSLSTLALPPASMPNSCLITVNSLPASSFFSSRNLFGIFQW